MNYFWLREFKLYDDEKKKITKDSYTLKKKMLLFSSHVLLRELPPTFDHKSPPVLLNKPLDPHLVAKIAL